MSDYDNVLLVPTSISDMRHRSDVNLSSPFRGLFPLIASPMRGISGWELVVEMGKNNCLGILHRFATVEERVANIDMIYNEGVEYGVAIGVNDCQVELDIAEYAVEHGACLICVDIANGYIPQVGETGRRLRNRLGSKVRLMVGNVITKEGSDYAVRSGFDLVRVGIGSGNVCTTRLMTGVGRNTLFALKECYNTDDVGLVADGGIRHPGDAVKAFACNADFVMIGSALAYANEAEDKEGYIYGMASEENHTANGKEIKSIEGKKIRIELSEKKPLKNILDQFLWGIRSACTYLDCSSYTQLPYKSRMVPVNEFLE